MSRILDAKYEKEDIKKVMIENIRTCPKKERERLITLLRRFEDLFGGTLGTCNTTPLYLELRYAVKPVCSGPYIILRVHESMFKKEVKILVILGVLGYANDSKWGALSFAQPNPKTNRALFLNDLRNLNRQLKRKTYYYG